MHQIKCFKRKSILCCFSNSTKGMTSKWVMSDKSSENLFWHYQLIVEEKNWTVFINTFIPKWDILKTQTMFVIDIDEKNFLNIILVKHWQRFIVPKNYFRWQHFTSSKAIFVQHYPTVIADEKKYEGRFSELQIL